MLTRSANRAMIREKCSSNAAFESALRAKTNYQTRVGRLKSERSKSGVSNNESNVITMKNRVLLYVAAFTIAGLAGCATRVPTVDYHHGMHQKKVQALKHWDAMAKQVVDKTMADPKFTGRAIAVNELPNTTVFGGTFNQLIKTELLKRNALDVAGGGTAPTLHVQTQLLRHPGKRYTFNPSSLLTGLIGGTVQIITGGAFGTQRETTSELLVISLVKEGTTPILGVKQIVYVDRDEDVAFYVQPAKLARNEQASTIKVTTVP